MQAQQLDLVFAKIERLRPEFQRKVLKIMIDNKMQHWMVSQAEIGRNDKRHTLYPNLMTQFCDKFMLSMGSSEDKIYDLEPFIETVLKKYNEHKTMIQIK